MAALDDVETPSLLFAEQASAPTTPASGLWRAYFKADGIYIVDDAGNETGPLGPTGGAPASTYALVGASESTSSTSFGDLTTAGPAPVHTVPASGKVKVTLTAFLRSGSASGASAQMTFALSGANTAAAGTHPTMSIGPSGHANAVEGGLSRVVHLSGLTPGSTTFTAKYKSGAASSATFASRSILVEDM